MKWRGVAPIVNLVDQVYEKGVRIAKAAFRPIAERLHRAPDLPKWSLTISPLSGYNINPLLPKGAQPLGQRGTSFNF
jgi:hypothetical protein